MLETMNETKKRLNNFFNEEANNFLVVTRLDNNSDVALKSVGHTILWACALDEFYKKSYPDNYDDVCAQDEKFGIVAGIRYARNRAVHQFTQLLYIADGAMLPALLPMPFFEINWRPVSDLPKPDKGHEHKKLEGFYTKHLENKPVRYAIQDLKIYFERISQAHLTSVSI